MEQMNIKSLLRSKQTLLESKLDVLINHPVTKGDHCEGAWIDFFQAFCPANMRWIRGSYSTAKGRSASRSILLSMMPCTPR